VQIRAVLFDMDGTLVNSDAAVQRAWTAWAGEHGVDAAEAIALAHGSPSEPTVRKLLPHLDEGAIAVSVARHMELQYSDLSDVVAAPGALELLGILATMFDPRTLHTREVQQRVRDAFGELVFQAVINRTVRFPETTVAGEPITTWAPNSNGAVAYRLLAREVLAR
jgi:beta-phosphoglucomutase-like phosphatase (HAD superfamily)